MPKAYWIVHADVSNLEAFKAYVEANADSLKEHGAKFLARAGNFQAVEGTTKPRNSIVEFPNYEAALKCWHSPSYQAARSLRLNAADIDIIIVEGLE